MGVSVLNTHALSPELYGDVRYVTNIINFFSGILLVGYFVSGSRLLAVSRTTEEAARIKGGILLILGIVATVMIIMILLCGLVHQFILHKDYSYLFYCALPVCISPLLTNYINTTAQGDNSIGLISMGRLLPPLTYLIIAYFVYKYIPPSPKLMLWLHNGIALLILISLILSNNPSFKDLKHSINLLKEENRRYGLHVYFGSLANLSIPYIAGVTLGLFAANNSNVAFYTLALTISTPLMTAPSVIGTTYFKKFASQNKITKKVINATVGISAISLIGYVIIIFPLVRFLYDSSYQRVAIYGAFLAIAAVAQGLGDVFNRFLGAHGQGKQLRNGAWFSGGVSIIGYTIGVYFFEIEGAIITRILSSGVYMAAMIIYYLLFTRKITKSK